MDRGRLSTLPGATERARGIKMVLFLLKFSLTSLPLCVLWLQNMPLTQRSDTGLTRLGAQHYSLPPMPVGSMPLLQVPSIYVLTGRGKRWLTKKYLHEQRAPAPGASGSIGRQCVLC